MTMASVVFVCTGNICRSVTAERVLQAHLERSGDEAVVDSAGISDEEAGNPIDPTQTQVLSTAGYRTEDHVARQITSDWLADRDVAIAMTRGHYRALQNLIGDLPAEVRPQLRMLREFDPRVARDDAVDAPAPDVDDPWAGELKNFEETLETIEVSVPGITDYLHSLAEQTR